MMIMAMMMAMTITANAMSYTAAKNEALFLSDKMAYELNLTDAQYDAVYEINLDYLMSVNGRNDAYGTLWNRRNTDLKYVLTAWQYEKFMDMSYFYRPLTWKNGSWTFNVYSHYSNKNHFYKAHPKAYVTYKGGHNKVHGSHYAHMGKPAPAPAMGHRNAPMPDRGARVMNDKGHMSNHNMGNHNAHKAPNREVAMNTRNNHSGSGHFLRPSGSKRP